MSLRPTVAEIGQSSAWPEGDAAPFPDGPLGLKALDDPKKQEARTFWPDLQLTAISITA